MNESQRSVIALAAYVVALVLFVFFFGRAAWEWATWNASEGTFDFGILKVTTRPAFPNDARSVVVGLVIPVMVAAWGRVLQVSKKP